MNSPIKETRASVGLVLLLSGMSAFPPITTDIYLPALPALTQDLHGAIAQGQITLAAYVVGLGFGQLVYGPWSDRIGRRPIMLIGIAVYLAASIGCALAGSMQQMIALRFLQAAGACSGVVVSSAVVRDRFDYRESARIFSSLMTLRNIAPIVAPIAGGMIVTWLNWRAIFWALALFSLILGVCVLFGLRESRTEEVIVRARSESPLRAYLEMLKNSRVIGYMLTGALNFASMFAWIITAPHLIISVYKIPALYFGWIFGINAVGIIVGAQVNRRLLKSYLPDQLMSYGALGAAFAAVVLLADVLTGFGGALGVFIPLWLVISSLGFVTTNAQAGAMAVDPSRSGVTSALTGASQYAIAGLTTTVSALLATNPVVAMAVTITCCALGSLIFPARLLAERRSNAPLRPSVRF